MRDSGEQHRHDCYSTDIFVADIYDAMHFKRCYTLIQIWSGCTAVHYNRINAYFNPMGRILKQIFKEAALIVLVAAVIALVVNSFRDQGLSIIGTDSAVGPENTGNTDPPMSVREISLQKAMELYRTDKALFADARDANAYNRGHIKAALHLPQEEFDGWINEFMQKTDPGVTIITYCEGYYCPLASDLAQMLLMAGFENVYYLPDGWGNWNRERMPVESSE